MDSHSVLRDRAIISKDLCSLEYLSKLGVLNFTHEFLKLKEVL